jgi:succinate dehydrogenase / fumarate reductase membrane anchor subunit
LLLIVATFYHGALGLQVIIEDYIHHEGAKVASSIAVNALSLLCGLAGVLAVLKVLFGG